MCWRVAGQWRRILKVTRVKYKGAHVTDTDTLPNYIEQSVTVIKVGRFGRQPKCTESLRWAKNPCELTVHVLQVLHQNFAPTSTRFDKTNLQNRIEGIEERFCDPRVANIAEYPKVSTILLHGDRKCLPFVHWHIWIINFYFSSCRLAIAQIE